MVYLKTIEEGKYIKKETSTIKNIIITGAANGIGSFLVKQLLLVSPSIIENIGRNKFKAIYDLCET